MPPSPKRHQSPAQRENALSKSWFIYLNLALTFGAFAILYFYLPAKRDCAFVLNYNASQLSSPIVQRNGDVWHKIVVITDLDHDSKHPEKKDTWSSFMKKGILKISADEQKASVEWDDEREILLFSQLAAGGRSMELSDLKVFNGRLLSIDDRTGILYAINLKNEAIPWVLLNDGPGNVTKGFKGEWMAARDRHLYVGGLGIQ
jgi:soluble calcium-activated nucleotidase 1